MATNATWKKWLDLITPRSGRVRMESGQFVNTGDLASRIDSATNIFNQLQTAEYSPQVESKPLPELSSLRNTIVGTASLANGEIVIDGTSSLSAVYTNDFGRYQPGLISETGIRVRISNTATGHYEYGYGNDSGNRVGLELDNGNWYSFLESGGVRWYRKPRSEWLDPLDGTGPSGETVDLNGATLRITFGWYGGLSFLFRVAIADRDGGDRLITFDSSGDRDGAVTLEQPDLPIFAEANGGTLYIGGRHFGVYGRYNPNFRVTSTRPTTLGTVATTLIPLVSMRVKNASKWKSVPIKLSGESVIASVDGEYQIIINGTLTGDTWGNIPGIDATETAMEVDTSATAITGGYRCAAGIIAAGSGRASGAAQVDATELPLPAGSVITLAVATIAGTNADFTGLLRVSEEW